MVLLNLFQGCRPRTGRPVGISNTAGGPTVYGDFMCFTLWQHNQPTGIYCRPMVNLFNPRPEVYDICKYYFAHCMNCSQHNIGLRLLALCHQKSICWALTILTSPPPLPPSLPPGQVPGTPRARSGCRHFQGLHPAEMRVNIIYGTFQDILWSSN